MPIETQSDISVEKVAIGMDDLVAQRSDDRAQAFKSIHPALVYFLKDLEERSYDLEPRDAQATLRFTQMARIYLRALATYSADTKAWLDVFLAFKRLFETDPAVLRVRTKPRKYTYSTPWV